METTPSVEVRVLGQIAVDEETFEHDLKINEGYQAFASEVLRLALLSVAGLSAVWLKLYLPDTGIHSHPVHLPLFLELSFACFVLSAGTALMDKFVAADSLAYHLTALRRRGRNRPSSGSRPSDLELALRLEKKRDTRFFYCFILLTASIAGLVAGIAVFGFAMRTLMR